MYVHDAIDYLIEAEYAVEDVVDLLLEAGNTYYKPRHPFKNRANLGYLGPGPEKQIFLNAQSNQKVHGTSGIPWDCNRLAPYQHICIKRDPMTGKVLRKKAVAFDPDRVKDRNVRYRKWAKEQKALKAQGIEPFRPHLADIVGKHKEVLFKSDPTANRNAFQHHHPQQVALGGYSPLDMAG